jgi:hypothetical protein
MSRPPHVWVVGPRGPDELLPTMLVPIDWFWEWYRRTELLSDRLLAGILWVGRLRVGPFWIARELVVATVLSALYQVLPALVLTGVAFLFVQLLFGICVALSRSQLDSSGADGSDSPV